MKRIAVLPHAFARRVAALDKPVRMGLAGTLALSTIAAGSLVYAASASAAVPAFPDNIVVFPDRDFVSIEGYEGFVDETMTVTVTRNSEVIGRASGKVAPGGVALEVNHPGGVCWGNDPSYPQVTPDIQAGDKVSISITNSNVDDDTTTGSGSADEVTGSSTPGFNGPAVEVNGNVLKIRGTVGADIVLAQGEQRIINPDMVDTVIQKRDVRAVPGPLTPAPKGGYESSLEFDTANLTGPANFLATYVFDDIDGAPQTGAELAALAAAGGVRYMSWQVEDLDANRQGLTIAEYGELGGPGFGGCPAGPQQAGPVPPTNVIATRANNNSSTVSIKWTPAVPVPGTPPIIGYRVTATDLQSGPGTPNTVLEQATFGKLISGQQATGTSVSGLDSNRSYSVNVRSISQTDTGLLESLPGVTVPTELPDEDPPTVTLTPGGDTFAGPTEFTASSDEPGEIYWMLTPYSATTPGDIHLGGGAVNDEATLYDGPVTVESDTWLSVLSFDAAGNPSPQINRHIAITEASAPAAAPGGVSTNEVPVEGQFTVNWTAVTSDPAVTGYVIAWTGAAAGTVEVSASATSKTVTGLAPGSYQVTVAAKNVAGVGPASAPVAASVTEQLNVSAGADTTVARSAVGTGGVQLQATTTNVDSTSSPLTYLWERVSADTANPTVITTGTQYLSANNVASPMVRVPLVPAGSLTPNDVAEARNATLFFRVTLSRPGSTASPVSDIVKVTISNDTVSIATGRYRANSELRLNGSVNDAGATVRVYRRDRAGQANEAYTFIGTATLTAAPGGATWELRLRNAQVPANGPWFAVSADGGVAGPFTT